MRLDQAIPERFPEVSRRKARTLIASRRVLVNDRPVAVASREVSAADRIVIVEDLPDLEVIRETSDWIAVAKPAGMPTQATVDRGLRSLEELLRLRCGEIFVVHRIDTPTSGVVVFAKQRHSAASLSKLFAERKVTKIYLAQVEGTIEQEIGIDSAIEGKSALTIVRPLRASDTGTLVEAQILTGRMHQIRIHLQQIGHPVVGDRRYGSGTPAPRLMLHAWKLSHPDLGGDLVAPPPAELRV